MKRGSRKISGSEKGSVMLEFCLVLPIYLLIFGGTFMIFDLSMARLHLQEANRNIAWIQNDRFDSQNLIDGELYRRVVKYYELRNDLEQSMSGEPMWGFGELYEKYCEKKQDAKESAKSGKKPEPPPVLPWGKEISEYKENGVDLNINQSWADKLGGFLGDRLQNDFMKLHFGNMELEMERVSATYIGAVGVSSVLYPLPDKNSGLMESAVLYNRAYNRANAVSVSTSGRNRWICEIPGGSGSETVPLYDSSYTLTRARYDENDESGGEKQETTKVNGEMLVIRRTGNGDNREDARTVNDLTPLALGSKTSNILFGSWPSNGKLGDISLLLGVGL